MNKKILLLPVACMLMLVNCNTLKYILTKEDAASAIREMLTIGATAKALINKESLMQAVLPGDVSKVLAQIQQLGLSKEVDKFSNTLTAAATETAEQSIPVFLLGIKKMNIGDAIGIVKNGGTAATDYFRRTIGDSLRSTVSPIMKTALDKYNITREWEQLIGPAKLVVGNRLQLNLNIENLLAGVVTNAMFNKIAEQEVAIRTKAEARTTQKLQQVFGRDWSKVLPQ